MSYQKVRDFLDSKGFTREIMTMPESTATVDLAAAAIGVEVTITVPYCFIFTPDACSALYSARFRLTS